MNEKQINEALDLADSYIRDTWPTLYIAEKFHRRGIGPNAGMDFDKYPAQVAFLKDENKKNVVVMKCVQVGISECLIIISLVKAMKGWRLMYVLPIENLRNDFVKDRIDPAIKATPLYREIMNNSIGESDEVGMKHFGSGTIRLVASRSEGAFISFAADMLIIDELDKCDVDNLAMAPDRIQASDHKFDWRVGNPSFPKFGIHAAYLDSDQKEWVIECDICKRRQSLDFFQNVVSNTGQENEYRLLDREWRQGCGRDINTYCHRCGEPIDRFKPGSWIANRPDHNVSGYHFTQLFSPTVSIEEIYIDFVKARSDSTKLQIFYNSRLGLPYSAVGQSLSTALLQTKCVRDYKMPSVVKRCTMGVDVGSKLNIRISDYPQNNVRRAVHIESTTDWNDLEVLIKKFDVMYCVIDIRPEQRKVAELQDRFPGIVWACYYPEMEPLITFDLDEDRCLVKANRTASIDDMVGQILDGNMWLPIDFKSIDNGEYVSQMEAPQRKIDDKHKTPRYVWDEGGKADHYFHAENYDHLAMMIWQRIGVGVELKSAMERDVKRELSRDTVSVRKGMKGFA